MNCYNNYYTTIVILGLSGSTSMFDNWVVGDKRGYTLLIA